MATDTDTTKAAAAVEDFRENFEKLRAEIAKFIVGQEDIINDVLTAIICGGHVLLEGVPVLGKTALVNTIAQAMHLKFQRIQFTPDLLPGGHQGIRVPARSGILQRAVGGRD